MGFFIVFGQFHYTNSQNYTAMHSRPHDPIIQLVGWAGKPNELNVGLTSPTYKLIDGFIIESSLLGHESLMGQPWVLVWIAPLKLKYLSPFTPQSSNDRSLVWELRS